MRALLALCLLLIAQAQARELKLAAWNLSWLTLRPEGSPDLPPGVQPKREEDIATLASYARRLNADVVAFSEVDGPEIAARIFPPDRWQIHITQDHVVQRAGFAVANDIAVTENPDLTALDIYPKARFHLRSAADITLHFGGLDLRLLAVHLKSGCSRTRLPDPATPACVTLLRQTQPLHDWIAARGQDAFVVLGDFNRWMEGDDFLTRLAPDGVLLRPDARLSNPCWGGSGFLDHILPGGAARDLMVQGSLRVLRYDETSPEMRERLSDHCPISIKLTTP